MSRKISLIVLVVCSFALTAVVAQASTISIPIANGDFEAVASPTGGYPGSGPYSNYSYGSSSSTLPSWTMVGNNGSAGGVYTGSSLAGGANSSSPGPYFSSTWNPNTHSGSRMAYIYNSSNPPLSIWQQLKNPDGIAFTFGSIGDVLSVTLWQSKQINDGAGNLDIQLFRDSAPNAGGTMVTGGTQAFAIAAATHDWQSDTFTYTVTNSADVGKPLWLQLVNSGASGQALVDDVSVSYTPIPEPSTLVLLAAGLIGLLCYAWRKRR